MQNWLETGVITEMVVNGVITEMADNVTERGWMETFQFPQVV